MLKNKIFYKILFIICTIVVAMLISSNEASAASKKTNINNTTITFTSSYDYTGSAIKPIVTVRYNGRTLKNNTDYTVSYINNTNAGTGKIIIKGQRTYTGSVSKDFTIKKVNINTSSVELSNTSYVYTGKAIEPAVTVKLKGKILKKNIDYTVLYSNNINYGIGKIVILGTGNYNGMVSTSFRINRMDASNALSVKLSNTSYNYTGEEIKPTVTVKHKSKILTNNIDYTISYSNNINAGRSIITVNGKGNYTGSITKTFSIVRAKIKDLNVSFDPYNKYGYAYDGSEQKPSITIKLGSKELELNTDYTISYSNNINPGRACIRIDGKGNFIGTRRVYFDIDKREIDDCLWFELEGVWYGNMDYNKNNLFKDQNNTDGTWCSWKSSYCGEYHTYKMLEQLENKKYKFGLWCSTNDAVYLNDLHVDGASIKMKRLEDRALSNGSRCELVENVDYIIKSSYEIDLYDHCTWKYIIEGIGNYKGTQEIKVHGTVNGEVNISLSEDILFYDGTQHTPTVTVKSGSRRLLEGEEYDYTVVYKNNVNVGTATVEVQTKNRGTYVKEFEIRHNHIDGAIVHLYANDSYVDARVKSIQTKEDKNNNISKVTLKEKIDYEVNYKYDSYGRLKTIEINGINNFTGSIIIVNRDLEVWGVDFIKDGGYTDSSETILVQKISKEKFEKTYYQFNSN